MVSHMRWPVTLQAQVIQARERARSGDQRSIKYTEVFRMDGVGISIIETSTPYTTTTRPTPPHHTYTLNGRARLRGPRERRCTCYVAMHSVTSRCTRYVAMHPIRRCNAYGSGAPPPTTSTTAGIFSRRTQAASDAATQPRNTCLLEQQALHLIRRGAPDQKG